MNYKTNYAKLFLAAALTVCAAGAAAQKSGPEWTPLFNGRDLSNWDSYLRYPTRPGFENMKHDSLPPAYGLNNDPLHVFTVDSGRIHISGEIWGALTTKKVYGNYHLRYTIRWGEKKYYPKDKSSRDGGVLYHCSDRFDFAFDCWMRSMEMQVQENDMGDYWPVGAGVAEFMLRPDGRTIYKDTSDQYDARYPMIRHFPTRHYGRVWRSGNFESPHGQWTTAELVTRQADAVYIVNGFVVNRLFNIFRDDTKEQVTKGKIQLQSEGSEHYYGKVEIRPVSFKQRTPLLISKDSLVEVTAADEKIITITNNGEAVEIIAAELIGDDIANFQVTLPPLPLVLGNGKNLSLPVRMKPGYQKDNRVKLRLETVLGPVSGFSVDLLSK